MSDHPFDAKSPPSARPPEITVPAVLLGVTLSIVMGAANVYLGLRAGMTVSASIPAAVLSIGILRALRRTSILESNLVQTAASAGESLAAGIIFTMPALLLTGVWEQFDYWTTTLVALSGGLLGVLLMIPMRKVFVVDDEELKFPEGVACAEVLRAGSDDQGDGDPRDSGLRLILSGILVGGVFKVLQSFIGLFRNAAETAFASGGRVVFLGADISPALFSVGYIVTLPVAIQIFAGGFFGWIVAIPLLGTQGVVSDEPIAMAYELWSEKVRISLGVGAMIVGGVASIWRVRNGLLAAARHLVVVAQTREGKESVVVTERNLDGRVILALGIASVVLVTGIYYTLLQGAVGLTVLTTLLMLVMSFFFAAVASYIVGLVGNSNSPVSGMTITAVLGAGLLIMLFGFGGTNGIIATLGVAGVVCCVACTAGDVCNDLKTGHLVGASPRNQQIMQLIGILPAAFVMAPVMTVLHQGSINAGTGGIGGEELPAPQAGLFAALANGFFGEGKLPKEMVYWGMVVGVVLLVLDFLLRRANSKVRLHVMPVAVGIYLPVGLSVPILLGGIVRHFVQRREAPGTDTKTHRGILMTSGLIAGESLAGVLLGLLAYLGLQSLGLADALLKVLPIAWQDGTAQTISLVALAAIASWMYRRAVREIGFTRLSR